MAQAVAVLSCGWAAMAAATTAGFSQAAWEVVEGAASVQVTVTRSGDTSGAASVAYATSAGTALAGSHFTPTSGTLAWEPGDAALRIETPETTVVIVSDMESFPIQGAMPYQWVVPAGATAGWHVSNDPGAYEGVFSLRSDRIDDGESAQVELTRAFAAGNVTFRVRVSSEERFDKLRFVVDGVEAGAWSGSAVPGWQLFTAPVSAGTHTLRWSYEKDASAAIGYDAAWIDAVTLP